MTKISNHCLNNFETNKDPDVGKAIAQAAAMLAKKLNAPTPDAKPDQQLSTTSTSEQENAQTNPVEVASKTKNA